MILSYREDSSRLVARPGLRARCSRLRRAGHAPLRHRRPRRHRLGARVPHDGARARGGEPRRAGVQVVLRRHRRQRAADARSPEARPARRRHVGRHDVHDVVAVDARPAPARAVPVARRGVLRARPPARHHRSGVRRLRLPQHGRGVARLGHDVHARAGNEPRGSEEDAALVLGSRRADARAAARDGRARGRSARRGRGARVRGPSHRRLPGGADGGAGVPVVGGHQLPERAATRLSARLHGHDEPCLGRAHHRGTHSVDRGDGEGAGAARGVSGGRRTPSCSRRCSRARA